MPEVKSYIEKIRQEHNLGILNDISDNGITVKPSNPRLRSYDKDVCRSVHYFLVNGKSFLLPNRVNRLPAYKKKREEKRLRNTWLESPIHEMVPFEQWQYRQPDGLWSIPLERSYLLHDRKAEESADLQEFEDRLSNSILFIFDPSAVVEQCSTTLSDSDTFKDDHPILNKQTQRNIPPNSFTHILTGIDLEETPVSSLVINVELVISDIMLSYFWKKSPHPNFQFLKGYNFSKTLMNLVDSGELALPFGAHITRLATRRDILRHDFLREKLSLSQCLDFYKTDDWHTCLRRMAAFGTREDIECLLFLTKGRLNINATSPSNGKSPIHFAAQRGSDGIYVMKTLLQYNARSDLPDRNGKTAKQIAESHGINISSILNGEFEKNIWEKRFRETEKCTNIMAKMTRTMYHETYVKFGLLPLWSNMHLEEERTEVSAEISAEVQLAYSSVFHSPRELGDQHLPMATQDEASHEEYHASRGTFQ